jgi:hypothetical protein
MYFVAAIRVGNVLFVGHKPGEPFLCFLLCGIGDIAIRTTSNRNSRFIDSLGDLQSFRHYVTGPLVPKTRGKYCPALA